MFIICLRQDISFERSNQAFFMKSLFRPDRYQLLSWSAKVVDAKFRRTDQHRPEIETLYTVL